jgi:hypothetical protein
MAKRTAIPHLLEHLEVPVFQRSVLINEAISIAEKTGAGIVPLVDKVATQKGWQNNAAKTPREIKEALSPLWVNGAGVLLPEGFCVVDTDTEEAELWALKNLPETLTVKTLKGYHRYYATPGPIKQDRSKLVDGVDVVSRKNYAVYVGSVHPGTGHVEYFHENPYASITELPEWLYERLRDQGEGNRAEQHSKAVREASTVSVDVSQGAVKNAEEVIDYLKRSRPNTLDNLNDVSDGRDNRVYSVVLSLLQSGCGGLDDVLAVLVQFPLWQKVSEQKDVMAYLTHKVESAQNFIAENPAEMTVLHWRRRVSGAVLKPGLMKVLEAIGYEAHRLTQKTGNDATRLTLSSRQVALGSAMGKSPAARWMRTAEGERWIKKVSEPGKGSGYAPVYLLTVPRSVVVAEVVSIDVGHDAFRHRALASALPVYKELHRGSGTANELHERLGKSTSIRALRDNLNKLKDAEIAEKTKMVWELNEDHELNLDLYAEKVGTLGKREEQKEKYKIEQEYWALRRKNERSRTEEAA